MRVRHVQAAAVEQQEARERERGLVAQVRKGKDELDMKNQALLSLEAKLLQTQGMTSATA